jgi:hypothetical protein
MSSDSTVSVLVSSCDSGSVCAYNAHSTRYHSASRNIISAIFKHWRLFVFFLCHGAEKEASDSVNRTSISGRRTELLTQTSRVHACLRRARKLSKWLWRRTSYTGVTKTFRRAVLQITGSRSGTMRANGERTLRWKYCEFLKDVGMRLKVYAVRSMY